MQCVCQRDKRCVSTKQINYFYFLFFFSSVGVLFVQARLGGETSKKPVTINAVKGDVRKCTFRKNKIPCPPVNTFLSVAERKAKQ